MNEFRLFAHGEAFDVDAYVATATPAIRSWHTRRAFATDLAQFAAFQLT